MGEMDQRVRGQKKSLMAIDVTFVHESEFPGQTKVNKWKGYFENSGSCVHPISC